MLFWYNLPNYIVSSEGISVKKINTLLLTLALVCFALFSLTGCEDKKDQDPLVAVENTTEILTQKDKDQQKEKQERPNAKKQLKTAATKEEAIREEVPMPQISTDIFTLSDIEQNSHTLALNNQGMTFHTIDQSIVILNFFSTWCSPCRGEIPYLSDLKKKYKKKIFIAGILVNDEQNNETLKQFMSRYRVNYFISNGGQNDLFASKVAEALQLPENFSIPLTVIYKDGNYYTHYEGAVPVEMIDHDVQEAIK